MMQAHEIIPQNNDWVTIVFLVIFIFLATSKVLYKDRLWHLNMLFISKKYFLLFFDKSKSNLSNLFQTLLFVVQLLVLAMVLFIANEHYQIWETIKTLNDYLLIVLGIGLYFCFKYITGFFLGYIFNYTTEQVKITYDKVNYFNNLILWLLPFLLLSVYAKNYNFTLFKLTIFAAFFLLMLRYVLVFVNNKKLIFSNLFYFILYLCALEIAPLIIISKLTI